MAFFVSGSELLNYSAERRGIDPAKMLPFGIPIDPNFLTRWKKKEARAVLGLAPTKPPFSL